MQEYTEFRKKKARYSAISNNKKKQDHMNISKYCRIKKIIKVKNI